MHVLVLKSGYLRIRMTYMTVLLKYCGKSYATRKLCQQAFHVLAVTRKPVTAEQGHFHFSFLQTQLQRSEFVTRHCTFLALVQCQ